MLLDKSQVQIASTIDPALFEGSAASTSHPGDMRLLAEAWTAGVDYLATHDREHFLENCRLLEAVPFVVGTSGDFLAWYKAKLALLGESGR